MRRAARDYSRTAVILLTTALVVAALEVVAAVALAALPPRDPRLAHLTAQSPYFVTRPWARDYWREFDAITRLFEYRPYVVWKLAPFDGKLIRIDGQGRRATPGAVCGPDAHRVW